MSPTKAAIAAIFTLVANTVVAADTDLQIDNGYEGHVYLHYEPCMLEVNIPIAEKLFRGTSVLNEGTDKQQVVELCWFSPKVDLTLVPEEYHGHVVRVVNLLAPDGLVYTIALDRFEPKGTKSPKEAEF